MASLRPVPAALAGVFLFGCADPTPSTLNQKCIYDSDCDPMQYCEKAPGSSDGLCREGRDDTTTPGSTTADPTTTGPISTSAEAASSLPTLDPSSSDDTGDAGSGTTGGDSKAPTVVDVSPSDGESGVRADANLVVVFSEPMDEASVEAAFQSVDIPAAGVLFSWDDASTVLTIDPVEGLQYAEGTAPDEVEPLPHAFSITNAARDVAGNTMEEPLVVVFATLRRLRVRFAGLEGLTADIAQNGTTLGIEVCAGDQYYQAGTDGPVRGGFTFDISPLPEGITEFESATLSAEQYAYSGTPFNDLGDIRIEHVTYSTLPEIWTVVAHADLGVFSSSASFGTRTIDAPVQDDYDNDRGYSQYRLAFEVLTDFDGAQDFACFSKLSDELALDVDYLIP